MPQLFEVHEYRFVEPTFSGDGRPWWPIDGRVHKIDDVAKHLDLIATAYEEIAAAGAHTVVYANGSEVLHVGKPCDCRARAVAERAKTQTSTRTRLVKIMVAGTNLMPVKS